MTRAKLIMDDGHGTHESLQTISAFFSTSGEAKRAIRQIIPKTKSLDR